MRGLILEAKFPGNLYYCMGKQRDIVVEIDKFIEEKNGKGAFTYFAYFIYLAHILSWQTLLMLFNRCFIIYSRYFNA